MTVTDYTTLKPEQILLDDDYEPKKKKMLLKTEEDAKSDYNTVQSKFNPNQKW